MRIYVCKYSSAYKIYIVYNIRFTQFARFCAHSISIFFFLFPLQKSSLNLREASSASSGGKDKDRLSLSTDNKYTHIQNEGGGGGSGATASAAGGGNGISSAPPTGKRSMTEHSFEREDKKDSGNEKDANGALQQCITELAASIGSSALKVNEQRMPGGAATATATKVVGAAAQNDNKLEAAAGGGAGGDTEKEQHGKPLRKTTSHFVTVIEVKEAKDKDIDVENAVSSSATSTSATTTTTTTSVNASASSTFRYPDQRSKAATEATAPPLSPSMTSPAMSASSYAAHLEKKKMPPR